MVVQVYQPSEISLDLRPSPHRHLRVHTKLVALQRGVDRYQTGVRVGAGRVLWCPGLSGQLGRVHPQGACH